MCNVNRQVLCHQVQHRDASRRLHASEFCGRNIHVMSSFVMKIIGSIRLLPMGAKDCLDVRIGELARVTKTSAQ